MPLYEYGCATCGKQAEAYNSVANRAAGPSCHGRMEKRVSRVVQVNAPTGAALRSDYKLYTEASQELAHAGVSTSDMWNTAKATANAMVAASEAPAITPTQ